MIRSLDDIRSVAISDLGPLNLDKGTRCYWVHSWDDQSKVRVRTISSLEECSTISEDIPMYDSHPLDRQ